MDHRRINGRVWELEGITTRLMLRHDRSDGAVVGFLRSKGVSGKELITVMRRLFDLMLCIALRADSAGNSLQGQSFLPPPILAYAGLHNEFELSNEDPRISRPCKPCTPTPCVLA
jgi:hypothetical protein